MLWTWLRSRLSLLVLIAGMFALAAWSFQALHVSHPLLAAAGLVAGSTSLGWMVRQVWVWPRVIRRAELRWNQGAPPEDVLAMLSTTHATRGELGRRGAELRGILHLCADHREGAWGAFLEAQLLLLPFWRRWQMFAFLRQASTGGDEAAARLGTRLAKVAPAFGRLRHLLALLAFRRGDLEAAWAYLQEAVLCTPEDPLLLEDALLTTLHPLQQIQNGRGRAPEQGPAPVFYGALNRLLFRHGDPRLPWDRTSPARYLLREGRHELVLALAHSLPDELRPAPLWATEIGALRDLGDLDGAAMALDHACRIHPGSFELWIQRHEIAVERRRMDEAARFLEEAEALLQGMAPDSAERYLWLCRKAEFAYWELGDADQAWSLLQRVPPEAQDTGHPPLVLELLVAQGHHEEAYQKVTEALKAAPEDVDLLLLQADCLAGMHAWEALLAFLEHQKEPIRTRGDYWNLLGLAQGHLGQKLISRDHLERAAFTEPQNVQFVLDAGHACMDLGEWDRAAHHWRQALRLDDRNEEALIQLAETRRLLHDLEGAKRYLRECLLHHPHSAQAQEYLAELEAN